MNFGAMLANEQIYDSVWHALVYENLFLALLADPRDSETFRPLDMHHGMEVRLGVSKGPICPSFI